MSRQTRLIVILAGMALVGVVALVVIAQRYPNVIAQRGDGQGQTAGQAARAADAQVDGFVRVRLALRDTIDAGTFDGMEPAARAFVFAAERDRVLSVARVHAADYRELRQHFRQWEQDPAQLPSIWQTAFETRHEVLSICNLGELEPLDR